MKITPPDQAWEDVSHNAAIQKQVFVKNGEVPHVTQFARSIFKPGHDCEAHSHEDMWEVFHVTAGTLSIAVDGETHQLEAGSSITLAPGEVHALRNDGADDLHLTYFGIVV